MQIIKDFKEFIGKGNAIDLAVGVIIGSAMTTILKSFVEELVVPLTGLMGKAEFTNSYLVLKGVVPDGLPLLEARKIAGTVVLGYGQFLTVLINTLILAFVVFMVVRGINQLRKKQAVEEAAAVPAPPPPPPSPEELLLTDIRDLLKARPL